MSGHKKLFLKFGLGILFLIVLLVGFGFLLPYLINLEPLREKIVSAISQKLDGKVTYRRLDLTYFPKPHVKIQQINFLIPGKAEGTVKSVEVYPEWISLLKGEIQIGTIRIESPHVNVRLAKEVPKIKEKIEPSPFKKIQEMFAQASAIVPIKTGIIGDGRLNLYTEKKLLFTFTDIGTKIVLSPEKNKLDMTCRSNLWERMKFNAVMAPRPLRGEGHLEVKNFYSHSLFHSFLPDPPVNLKEASSNLNIDLEIGGDSDLKATIEASIPSFILRAKEKEVVIKGSRLKGTFSMKESRMVAVLQEWNLKDPRLKLSGRFQMDRAIPSVLVEIEGRNIDIISTRKVILDLMEKSPSIQTVFGYLRGGTLPQLSLKLSGKSFGDLGKAEPMALRGRMTDGFIHIALPIFATPLDLREVSGEAVISNGLLLTKNIEAKWEKVDIQGAQLKIGLKGKEVPFRLEALIDTDLSQLIPNLRRLLKEESLPKEIAEIKRLEGRARGSIVLGDSLSNLKVKASVQDIRLVAHYGRIPFPLTIDGGDTSYDGERISVQNLKGKVGRSTFSGLRAELKLKKEPFLEIQSGECSVMLDEFHSYPPLREVLKKVIRDTTSLKGAIHLSQMRMKGPIHRLKNWHLEAVGHWEGLSLDAHLVPGTISSPKGKFKVDPKTITLSEVESRFLNASIRLSGTLGNYLDEIDGVEMEMDGKVTPREIQWLLESLKAKREIPIRSSISFTRTHLSWHRRGHTSFRGEFLVEKGPKIALSLIQKPGHLKVESLTLRDEVSNCTTTLDHTEGMLKVAFSGELFEQTLDKIFSGYQFQNGRLKGDFRAHLAIDQPIRSTIQGRLEADELSFPWQLQKPLEIEHITLRGEGRHLTVGKARLSWGEMALSLSGKGSFSERGLLIDIDLSAGHIDFQQIAESFKKEKSDKGDQDSSKFQVEGTIRFKANSFQYGRFIWEPFWANITIGPNRVEAKIMEASLCGISTPGVVRVLDQELFFHIYPTIEGRQLKHVVSCLQGQEIRMTGVVDLKGRLFSQGQAQELLQSLKGDLELKAKNGQIYDMVVLSRILDLINITEIYRGKLPDLKKEGLLYNLIMLKGSFHNGKFIIQEATLDGKTLEMVAKGELDFINEEMKLTVLVAPLKTVDRIIKFIPLVRDILAGTLISIPVGVQGSLKDPKVSYLSPTAIGEELVEMMKRTLKLPVKLFEPFFPKKETISP